MNQFDQRRDRLYETWQHDLPVVIAYSRHRLYLSDTVRPGLLLVTPNERIYYSTRAHELCNNEVDADASIEVNSTSQALDLIDNRIGTDRVGLEASKIPATMRDRIAKALGVTDSMDVTGSLRDVRMVKSADEIEKLRTATQQSESAHERVTQVLEPGMEELELAAEAEAAARRDGHEGIMTHGRFDAYLPYGLISSGDNLSEMGSYAYVSHGTGPTRAFPVSAGHRVIEEDDPVVVDIGGVHYGYNADVSRTYVAGTSPSKRIEDAYEALEKVYVAIEDELVAGTPARDVFRRGQAAAADTSFEEYFQGYGTKKGPFIGHGIGLEIDEPPILSPRNDDPVPANATVTIEIFFVFPDGGGVKIEESCRVRENQSPEVLSSTPRRLYQIEP